MKRLFLMLACTLALGFPARPEEGMWIPLLLEQLNSRRMQDLGLKLSAEDIYSVNRSSLKDAIVQFGGGCTAEIVSPNGLILTNHHCGLGAIQRLSSLENDYITNGFWAESGEKELPCTGLSVTLLVRMEDVTAKMMEGITATTDQFKRQQILQLNAAKIEKEAVAGTRYEARVRSFFYGNQFYLMVNEVFRDVRLVGAPPSSIGKFGGDTDNWMWPRHTGDFSVFRIYADQNNQPAAYSKDNVPYRPKNFLKISLKGYEKGDFTFVFGYPGSTREYLTSWGVDATANRENPLRIELRRMRLDIIDAAMRDNRLIRIQYASKAAGIANFWKKMIGETRGIRQFDAISKKESFEKEFRAWTDADPGRRKRYGALLESFRTTYETNMPLNLSAICLTEAGQGIEIIRFAAGFSDLVKKSKDRNTSDEEIARIVTGLKKASADFYKNYAPEVDRKVASLMLAALAGRTDPQWRPPVIDEIRKKYDGDYDRYAAFLFSRSLFPDSSAMAEFLTAFKPSAVSKLEKDPVFRLMTGIYQTVETRVSPALTAYSTRIDSLQRIYMEAQMLMQPGKPFYPDANSTLRIAFGKVDDYSPADAVRYGWFTTLEGVMEKEDTAVYDYRVHSRLKELHGAKEYGPYADADGSLHVAFTASNHTTGGNSGSPVLNAEGHLIGINFDRNWEGTLSDLMYNPGQCRNISLDIRYCLFVIDKLGGCRRLIEEMDIVQR